MNLEIISVIIGVNLLMVSLCGISLLIFRFFKNQKSDSSTFLQFNKILELIEKIHKSNRGRFENIEKTVSTLCKNTLNLMNTLDDLTKQIVEDFTEIYCDLNEQDCSICSFRDKCSIYNNTDSSDMEKGFSSEVTFIDDNQNSSVSCEKLCSIEVVNTKGESRTFDLDIEGYKTLYSTLLQEGVPDQVVRAYLGKLKDICKYHPGCSVRLIMSKNPYCETRLIEEPSDISENLQEEKIISPNSKIIKTLEDLYHSND